MSVLDEIHEQPAAVDRMLERNSGLVADLASLTEGATHVVIAARGTSDNAARYAQYVWGARNRLVVGLTTPSLFGPLQSPPDLTGALVVGISQSGQSPDLVEVLAEAVRQGRPTLAITNDPASPLASRAGCVMDLAAGPERGIPATKTYTTQLAAVALASLAFAGDDMEPLACLPDRLQEALDRATDLEAAVDVLADAERCAVVGRGYHISTVFEWALKLQEMAYLVAQPFSAADFLHGPVAVVDEGFPVLVIATAGPTFDQMATLAADMQERGAHVVTLSDVGGVPGDIVVEMPQVEPWLSPIVSAPVIQSYARSATLARGLDPESPRGLSKVIRTT